jgi:hypothetical protein
MTPFITVRGVMKSFRLVGLPFEPFSRLFALSDAELAARNAHRVFATTKPDIRVA